MAVYLSPGVYDREIDYSTNVSAVSTSIVGMIGTFSKGPINKPTLITDSSSLASTFGYSIKESTSFLSARDFLRYGNQLWVVRVAGSSAAKATGVLSDNDGVQFISVESKDEGTFYNGKTQIVVVNRDQILRTFTLQVYFDGTLVESYVDVSFLPTESNYFEAVINEASNYIQVTDTNDIAQTLNFQVVSCYLLGGNDGIVQTEATASKSAMLTIGEEGNQFVISYNVIGSAGNEIKLEIIKPDQPNSDLDVAFNRGVLTFFLATDENGEVIDSVNTYANFAFKLAKFSSFSIIRVDDVSTVISEAASYQFSGGQDAQPSDGVGESEVYKALALFESAEKININLLMTPGFYYPSVIKRACDICEKRGDAMFIADPPFGLTREQVIDWHNGNNGEFAAFNSSYGALYWSWVQEYDEYLDMNRWVPPSGFVAGQFAYNDTVAEPWFAPAGLNRGLLANALKVEVETSKGDRDALYSGGNSINAIVNFESQGIVLWGQRTLQRKPSALDRVNVRRLLLYIRKAIALSSLYMTFEQNDYITWGMWKDMVNPFMNDILSRRGVYGYKTVMDNTTVSQEDIDNNRMPGKVWIQPTKSAEMIPIDFVLTKTGASFE